LARNEKTRRGGLLRAAEGTRTLDLLHGKQLIGRRLARVPYSFPTYASTLGRAAITVAVKLDHSRMGR
jgi:hypothetical protein